MIQRAGPSTRAVHGGHPPRAVGDPVAEPIYQSSTFLNPAGTSEGLLYTRYGNNPNQKEIGARLASLEGAEAAILLSSGMGATALAHLAVLDPGDHLISCRQIYGGTYRLFNDELTRLGIEVTFVDHRSPEKWLDAARPNTRAIFVETPTNPLVRLVDLAPLAQLRDDLGATLLVDSTFASPVNFRPLEHGADVVIHSATKYLSGHSDVIAGAVMGSAETIERITRLMQVWGQSPDPFAAWLTLRGIKTLGVRMERHNRNGRAFSAWAAQHPAIEAVHHPSLSTHPEHRLAATVLNGFGGMVGLELRGGASAVQRALGAMRLVTHAPSLGGVETLVSVPRYTSHAGLSSGELSAAGIGDGFLRVSLGIEDIEDIIDDFEQALRVAGGTDR